MVRRYLALLLVGACLFSVLSVSASLPASGMEAGVGPTVPVGDDTLVVDRQTGETDGRLDRGGGPSASRQTSSETYGLLPGWEEAYDGDCVDCHSPGQDDSKPIHPTDVRDRMAVKSWYYDDNDQIGPNRSMANPQPSWVTVKGRQLVCGDCHGVQDMSSFGRHVPNRSADPHAVHKAYTEAMGCERCHGEAAAAITHGVVSPMQMESFRDGELLSSQAEARFGDSDLGPGFGWTRYGTADSGAVQPRSCGDCHGKLHGARMGFAFDGGSRAGPISDARSTVGFQYDPVSLRCEACHPSDVHAVHTDARIMDEATVTELEAGERIETDGAETCLECHGSGIVEQYGPHGKKQTARMLGLLGPMDSAPNSSIGGMQGGDCGFCHR